MLPVSSLLTHLLLLLAVAGGMSHVFKVIHCCSRLVLFLQHPLLVMMPILRTTRNDCSSIATARNCNEHHAVCFTHCFCSGVTTLASPLLLESECSRKKQKRVHNQSLPEAGRPPSPAKLAQPSFTSNNASAHPLFLGCHPEIVIQKLSAHCSAA
jgi:hypothetical protein